jgi:PPOX class probable F420-dependent enzyme
MSGTELAFGVRVAAVPEPQPASPPTTVRVAVNMPSLRPIMGSCASVAKLPKWALELLDQARVGRLGLIDDEHHPRVLPVTFALAGGALVTAVDHKRKDVPPDRLARLRWLRARPRAALTVDHYEDDWSRLAWVQALGAVRILDDAPNAVAALTARYEQYRDHPPAGPVIELTPDRLVWWRP